MATLYGAKATKELVNKPSEKIEAVYNRGKVRFLYDEITFSGEVALNDVIKMFEIPENALVKNVRVISPDLGTTGAFKIGWAASEDAAEAADDDGFFTAASLDFVGGAEDQEIANSVAGFLKKFASKVRVQLECTQATDAADGLTLKLMAEIIEPQ